MSKLFHKDKAILGLDISPTSLKIMSIDTHHWTVLGYASLDANPQDIDTSLETNGEYIATQLKELVESKKIGRFNSNQVVMSIPTARSYLRSVVIPKTVKSPFEDSIRIEAEQYIPTPIAQLYIDYEITHEDDKSTTLLMCAVPRKIVDNCVQAAQTAGFEVILVEPSILAVARLLRYTEDGSLPTVIVDIGSAATDIAVVDDKLKVTGSLSVGGNDFTEAIAKEFDVSLEAAHQLKVLNGLAKSPKQKGINSALEPDLTRICREVKKIIRYYNERIPGAKAIEQVIVVGGGSNIPGIGDFFTESLVIASRVTSPWQLLDFAKLPQPARQFKPRYITVAGLASIKAEEVWK